MGLLVSSRFFFCFFFSRTCDLRRSQDSEAAQAVESLRQTSALDRFDGGLEGTRAFEPPDLPNPAALGSHVYRVSGTLHRSHHEELFLRKNIKQRKLKLSRRFTMQVLRPANGRI